MFKKILVGFDGSESSSRAARAALQFATEQDAEVCLLSVIEHLPHYAATVGEMDEERDHALRYFDEGQQSLKDEAETLGIKLRTETQTGHAAQALVRMAEEGEFDLVVLGHTGHSDIWGRFMGTTADKVSRHAPCSVLIVRLAVSLRGASCGTFTPKGGVAQIPSAPLRAAYRRDELLRRLHL